MLAARRLLAAHRHIRAINIAASRTFSCTPDDDVLFSQAGGARIITLNRPSALNSLNLSMINKIHPKIKEWEDDPRTTMIIMKAAGGKAFCAGGDIVAVTEAARGGDYSLGEEFFRAEYRLNHSIATCEVPYIALIDGVTMGGGVGLSIHGGDRVCTERTLFAMPETGIGLFPDVGGSYFLPRLSLHLGLYLALTGDRLRGRDVYKAGVATRMVDSSTLARLEQELCAMVTPTDQDITNLLRAHHEACTTGRETDFLRLRDREEEIKRTFCAASIEDIFQNLENEDTEWSREQLALLRTKSPTSLKVTHKQLVLGETLNLGECLQMEFNIACNCLRHNDFCEGVRALLVDKDKRPRWEPGTLEQTSDRHRDSFFEPPPGVPELRL